MARLRSLGYVHFAPHLVCLNSNRVALFGNIALSIIAIASTKRYSSVLKRVLAFQNTCFKFKALKRYINFLNGELFQKYLVSFLEESKFFFLALVLFSYFQQRSARILSKNLLKKA